MKKARVKQTHNGSISIGGSLYTRDSDPFDLADDDPAWECEFIEEVETKPIKKTATPKKTGFKKAKPKGK